MEVLDPTASALPVASLQGTSPAAAAHAVAGTGGTPEQRAAVLADKLASGSLEQIHAFGREVGAQASAHTDAILSKVRAADLETMGSKLSQIVGAAQSLNMGALSGNRSRVPLVGSLIDKLRLKGGEVLRRFQDVQAQIDTLLAEVDTMQAGLAERNLALESSFESVRQEHELLGVHVLAGEAAAVRLKARLEKDAGADTDALKRQAHADLRAATAALEKRVADLRVLQHAALQQLPMIRMVQANNRMLIEKFHTIRELTVPAWKRQFMLALSLNEQKAAVRLADSIDDATNEFLLENARLLEKNTISTAKANQRLVIDVDTLRQVHDSLLSTMQEVIQINRDGVQQRATISQQLTDMRQSMTRQLDGRS